jgi:hypothetical protein
MTTDTGISDIGNSDTGDSSATNTKRGVVDWFNFEHGFGFIVPEKGGPSVFVHFTEIAGTVFTTHCKTETLSRMNRIGHHTHRRLAMSA